MISKYFDSRQKLLVWLLYISQLMIIFAFWWHNSGSLLGTGSSKNICLALGRIAGLVGAYAILWQFVLIGRAKWIEQSFGHDKLSRLHRWNGYIAFFSLLAHVILITISVNGNFLSAFWRVSTTRQNVWLALIAFYILLGVVVMSVAIARRNYKYETWYFVHLLTYLVIALAFLHQIRGGSFIDQPLFLAYWYVIYVLVAINHLVARFVKPLYSFYNHNFRVVDVKPETHDITSIYMTGTALAEYKIKPGQFGLFRFLDSERWWQSHPFSFSEIEHGQNLRISVKNLGDYSGNIKTLKKGTPVIIEGPYGIFTLPAKTKKLLFIGAGIGITPLRALAEEAESKNINTVLLYGARTNDDLPFIDELAKFKNLTSHFFLSRQPPIKQISMDVINEYASDFKKRDIYLCGPPAMVDVITKSLLKSGVPSAQLHFEKFALI